MQAAGPMKNPKRFIFPKEFDIALMRWVCANSAHSAGHGKTEKKYAGVVAIFFTHEYLSRASDVPPSKLKMVRDRANQQVKEHLAVLSATSLHFDLLKSMEGWDSSSIQSSKKLMTSPARREL